MQIPSWNALAVGMLALAGFVVPAFNLVLDPYGVFGVSWPRSSHAMNERFLKMEHLLAHKDRHNAFILGSSVMGSFDPQVADSRAPGRRFYNLSFMAGTPQEALQALQALKRAGVHIDEVLMGLDVFAFRESDAVDRPDRRLHPSVQDQSRLTWLSSYLFAASFADGLTRITQNLGAERIRFDIGGNGRYVLVAQEVELARDPEAYARQHLEMNKAGAQPTRIQWVESRFTEFSQLVSWLQAERVQARFFIHPVNNRVLAAYSPASLSEFRRRLVEIAGPMPDFMGDPVAGADEFYLDLKHYSPVLATRVMAQVLGDKTPVLARQQLIPCPGAACPDQTSPGG